jgi:transcriptional regulator with XRE-family HTH domain
MSSALSQPFVNEIKAARQSKGLTQRALGERVGLPQSHISRIENGTVDLQVSSLVAIARALDLELMLIPRPSLNAVRAVQHSQRSPRAYPVDQHINLLHELRHRATSLLRSSPSASLEKLRRVTTDLADLSGTLGERQQADELAAAALEAMGNLRKLESKDLTQATRGVLLKEMAASTRRLTKMHQALFSSTANRSSSPQPAYRLDDDGDGNV